MLRVEDDSDLGFCTKTYSQAEGVGAAKTDPFYGLRSDSIQPEVAHWGISGSLDCNKQTKNDCLSTEDNSMLWFDHSSSSGEFFANSSCTWVYTKKYIKRNGDKEDRANGTRVYYSPEVP